MKTRYLASSLESLCFADHKIAFVSGPRQCGKTTLSKMLLEQRGAGRYWNWDDIELRRLWAHQPRGVVPVSADLTPLVILDEIHKAKTWKRTLKGLYDTASSPVDFLVTGSARLAVFRKGSDSLLGRYLPLRLHPLSVREMDDHESETPTSAMEHLFARAKRRHRGQHDAIEAIMEFGPFPEPLLAQSVRKSRLWRRTRVEAIIREDLRDLTRIPELGRIEMLASLLPPRVGSAVGVASLSGDLEVSFNTVKRWLMQLRELYYVFEVKPFHGKIARSLRKEGKVYMWDCSEVPGRGERFENLVAGHLLKACHFWTDTGEGQFDLWYLRDKDKHEIDFLVTLDGEPWLPVEVKLSETDPSPHWRRFLPMLGCGRGLQVISTPGHWREHDVTGGTVLVASAGEALGYLV